jgi:hypothetical protein
MYKSALQGATCTLPFAVAAPVPRLFLLFVLGILFALGGCGGGGSSNQPPVGPTTRTVSATAGAGGSIDPASRTVDAGSTATFTVTPDTGYSIGTVSGCGGSLVGNNYTTGAITGACTVAASFSLRAPAAASLGWEPVSVKLFRFTWDDVAGATEYRLFENPDGNSGFTQVASIAPGVRSRDLTVFLPARVNARYMLSACNAGGCTDSATVFVSGNLAQAVGYVKASNTDRSDYFGWSVALSGDGNTLAVAALSEASNAAGIDGNQADNSASGSGAVYVFTRSGGSWSQQAYVKASNTDASDGFGYSVALSGDGNTLAVGAVGEDSSATGIDGNQTDNSAGRGGSTSGSGAVYVFIRSGGSWSQQAYVKASNTDAFDDFGSSIALSGDGNTLAVGARGEDSSATGINDNQADNSASGSGAVYVFTRSGASWSQQAYVKASNTERGDWFGWSIALSGDGNTLAVGATGEDSNATGMNGNQTSNSGHNTGAVYVFTRSGGSWSQQAYVKASNTTARAPAGDGPDQFGWSVALSGDGSALAVGAPYEDGEATGINGNQAGNSATRDSGAVYLFIRSAGTWAQQAYMKASNTEVWDYFGWSVALSGDGNTLAVGAFGESGNAIGINGNQADNSALQSGAAYVFTRRGGAWVQQAYAKATKHAGRDWFASVALAGDGNTLAVGSPGESSSAIGINGNQADNSASASGAVYLY